MHHPVFAAFFCLFLLAAAAGSVASTSTITALLSSGDYAGARRAAETAYAENPADPAIALLYATTMQDGAKALEAYKKMVADTAFPDSFRAEAYFRLGCAAYMKGRYHKAGQYLKKAGEQDADAVVARFLNSIHDTLDSAGMASLARQAADTSSPQGKMACYFLGLHFLAKKDFAASLPYFNMSAGTCDTMWWSCGSFAGACYCAQSLGRREESISVLRHMKRVFPSYLEKPQLAKVKQAPVSPAPKDLRPQDLPSGLPSDTTAWLPRETGVKRDTVAKKDAHAPSPAARPSAAKANYCLQVGAFGSAENAGALKNDLAKRYSPVSVVAALVQDKPIYRVRVGVFGSRESAQSFGDTALTKKGLKFRIVEDVPVE